MNNLLEKKEVITNFEDLIHPYTLEDFNQQYWDKKPLLIQRQDPSYYQSLLSISKIDEILHYNRPTGTSIRVVKNQEPLDKARYENKDGSLNLNQIYASYSDGYTLVVNEIERFWKPLKTLCHTMSEYLNHKTMANMYLTPKNQKALLPHYDTHDVFVIQVEGKKHWKLYDAEYPTPLVHSFQPIFQREQLKNIREITLNAGDMMYIPRGIPHEAVTTDESSLHLTLGVYSVQWVDFITKALQNMAQYNVELRKALPVGFLNTDTADLSDKIETKLFELFNDVLNQESIEGAKHLFAQESRIKKRPMADGHFNSLDQIDTLTLDSGLIKRDNMNCKVQEMGTVSRIIFSGNVIRGPITISPALNFIASNEGSFQVHEIPVLNDANKLKLTKRLIRGGLLKMAE